MKLSTTTIISTLAAGVVALGATGHLSGFGVTITVDPNIQHGIAAIGAFVAPLLVRHAGNRDQQGNKLPPQ